MTLGERIRFWRKEKGLTQARLAELSGVATITIHQYESNKRSPRYDILMRLSEAMGIDTATLLEGFVTAEQISWEIDMPVEYVYAALFTPDKVPEETRNIVNRAASMLAIELSHARNDESEDKKSPVVSSEGQSECVEKSSISELEQLNEIINAMNRDELIEFIRIASEMLSNQNKNDV